MTKDSNIDYVNTVFEFPVLTKVYERPDYESLTKIKNELRANAASVPCDLGGGAHGHLGLVLTAADYALVTAVPYIRPNHPGPLTLPAGAGVTNLQREIARDDHKENLRVFHECVNVEKALIKQLNKALPPEYLKQYRNIHSNTITTSLTVILTTLFTRYGQVSDTYLREVEEKLRSRVFDITEPLVVLYNEIEDLHSLSIAAQNEFTETQLVNLGIQLIKNFNDFERGLDDWMACPRIDKTWVNFKTHFEAAHERLCDLRGPTMRNSSFQQTANSITQEVLREIKSDRNEVFNRLTQTESNIIAALSTTVSSSSNSSSTATNSLSSPTKQIVNVASNDAIQVEILKLLKQIKGEMKPEMKPKREPRNQKNNTNNNNKKQKFKRRRTNISNYCWSCGAWNHPSSKCRNKKEGHRDEATFENKMGGSLLYCQEANSE